MQNGALMQVVGFGCHVVLSLITQDHLGIVQSTLVNELTQQENTSGIVMSQI